MFVLCTFLAGYKGHESAQNDAKKSQKWMQTVSQGKEYSFQRVQISLQRITHSLQ